MDPHTAFRAEAASVLADAARALGYDGPLPPLETPPDPRLGDVGMPCFPLAKALRQAPQQVAKDVAGKARAREWVSEVRAEGPYVNLVMDRPRLAEAALKDPAAVLTAAAKPGRVLLEHTSANPNGPLHVGRARNPILGDTLARILRASGRATEAQYYMDNLGRQVALLYWGRANLDPASLPPLPASRAGKADHDLVRYYQAANERMENDAAVKAAVQGLVTRLEAAEPQLLAKVRSVYEGCFAGMQASLDRLGVRFDSIKDESDLVQGGDVEATIEALRKSPRAGQEPDGAWYLDLSDVLKGQKDRFYFTRKDQTSVYATRDVAYHAWKARQAGADGLLIDVLGEDHRLQALQVRTALESIGERAPTVVFYAFVKLPEGKMSTRANRVVFLDDLLDEAVERALVEVTKRRGDELPREALRSIAEAVGIAAVRFNIVRIQPEKGIEFQWEEALDFEGDSAPYVMYAYARASSLLRKAHEAGLQAATHRPGDGEVRLALVASRLPAVLEDAVAALAPHRVAAYALELAAALNEYYRDHPVLQCEDASVQAMRLAAVQLAHEALGRVHDALGLPRMASM